VLPVGAWLETGPSDAAELAVADIGSLTIHGDSRVRLVGTGPDQHRLELARGRVSASVVAPPRLFVVDTPAATAVDLGCAYELDVDETARTRLHVTSGAVSLERGETVAWVPAGYQVTAEKGKGPGLPIAVAAGAALRDAAGRFDGGEASALATLVELAGEEDVGMLWNLLGRTDRTGREAVLARLAALRPLPGDLAAEKIRAGDPATLENLREVLEADLFE
jgi:hypothetical protein